MSGSSGIKTILHRHPDHAQKDVLGMLCRLANMPANRPTPNGLIYAPTTLEDFQRRIAAIEQMEKDGASVDTLVESLRDLNRGTRIELPHLTPGKKLYRARHITQITEKPHHRSLISYPPQESVNKRGRLNAVGQSLFYCSLPAHENEETFDIGCLYECYVKPGDFYVVGEWIVQQPLLLSHMGFSHPDLSGAFRAGQPWMNVEDANPMISHIRDWTSRVFTRAAPDGAEDQYGMSIALAKYCMRDFDEPSDGFERASGVIYPSVATQFATDNIALLPCEVDRAVTLTKAWFVQIESVCKIQREMLMSNIAEPVAEMRLKKLDTSFRCRDGGAIVWLNELALLSPFFYSSTRS
jgi:hypothetical protein